MFSKSPELLQSEIRHSKMKIKMIDMLLESGTIEEKMDFILSDIRERECMKESENTQMLEFATRINPVCQSLSGAGKGGIWRLKATNDWHYCDSCFYNNNCERQKKIHGIVGCMDGTPNDKYTNADMIRNMSNAELLQFLKGCAVGGELYIDGVWIDNIEEWLEKECDNK